MQRIQQARLKFREIEDDGDSNWKGFTTSAARSWWFGRCVVEKGSGLIRGVDLKETRRPLESVRFEVLEKRPGH